MSRFISTLLEKEKDVIQTTLDRLEEASGGSAVDVRLTSEMIIEAKNKMRQLGLDPDDTTAAELYAALQSLIKLHDGFLAKRLGISDTGLVSLALPKVKDTASDIASKQTVWAVKHSVAKRLLKAASPKVLMKQLGYRSLESMSKRELIDELFAGAMIAKLDDWLKNFYKSFSKLTPSDFELREMLVKYPSAKRYLKLSDKFVSLHKNNVLEIKALGSAVILPMSLERLEGVTIVVLSKVLNSLNELKLYSSYLKFVQVQNDFGKLLADSIIDGPMSKANMAGQDLHWRLILNNLSDLSEEPASEGFEPQLQSEDVTIVPIEKSLYEIEPALHFWFQTGNLGLPYKDYSVSFNLIDAAVNYVNKFSVEEGSTFYLKEALWDEILQRYLHEGPLKDQVMQQVDNISASDEYTAEQIGGVAIA